MDTQDKKIDEKQDAAKVQEEVKKADATVKVASVKTEDKNAK